MRIALALPLIALLIGCNRATLQTMETEIAPTGVDRLILQGWETVSLLNPNEKSYDSHSIVWQRLKNGDWIDYVTISQDDFQRGHANRRWIHKIHDFDPASGTAILKVGEGDAPENSAAISYIYSWREWDLKNNRELKLIHVCDNPFEPFPESERALKLDDKTEQTGEGEPD